MGETDSKHQMGPFQSTLNEISKDTKDTKNLSIQQSVSPTLESPNVNLMPKLQLNAANM